MTTPHTALPQELCPHWARFFAVGNHWIAYCSSVACETMDKQRPGWRDHGEIPRNPTCVLGYRDELARSSPGIITEDTVMNASRWQRWMSHAFKTQGVNVQEFTHPERMTDVLWSTICAAWMSFCAQEQEEGEEQS